MIQRIARGMWMIRRVGKSLALAMVRPDLANIGTELEIAILGARHKATIIADSPFDPENHALRG